MSWVNCCGFEIKAPMGSGQLRKHTYIYILMYTFLRIHTYLYILTYTYLRTHTTVTIAKKYFQRKLFSTAWKKQIINFKIPVNGLCFMVFEWGACMQKLMKSSEILDQPKLFWPVKRIFNQQKKFLTGQNKKFSTQNRNLKRSIFI